MPSKRCYFHPECKTSVFGLPRDAGLRQQWLQFVFNSVPADYNANLAICAAYFTEDRFKNLHEFNAGFVQRLFLKDEAVPTLKAEAAVYGPKPVSSNIVSVCVLVASRPMRFGYATSPTNGSTHQQTFM